MKVILINPFMNLKEFGAYGRFMQPVPPIGLAYIAAVLEKEGVGVEIIDNFVLRLDTGKLLAEIKRRQPDIVGISCLTPSAPGVFALARLIKEYNKTIKVVLGNIHATIFADSILKREAVDVVVRGEGEWTMRELVKAIRDNRLLTSVQGISFKDGPDVIHNEDRALISNLDELPYPAWRLLPIKHYGFLPFMDIRKPGLSMLSSRGCPYKCTFCSLVKLGSVYRRRAPLSVVDEFEYIVENFPIKQIGFVDPIFALSKKNTLEICNEIIRRKLNKKILWLCETRIDLMDKEILDIMREAGCRRILYGIEAGVNETLTAIGKKYNRQTIIDTIRRTRAAGIESSGLFIIGVPGETKEMIQETIRFARKLDIDFAKFALAVPYPGSQLYDDFVQSGKLNREDWENYITFHTNPEAVVAISETVLPAELIALQRKAHKEFYLQPKIIAKHLTKIRTISLKDLISGLYTLFSYRSR